jgi:hypothetical protein
LNIAFHDYALRYDAALSDVRVDRAIRDTFPDEVLTPLGDLAGLSSMPTEPSSATKAYYDKGGAEGVLVTLGPGVTERRAVLLAPMVLRALMGRFRAVIGRSQG